MGPGDSNTNASNITRNPDYNWSSTKDYKSNTTTFYNMDIVKKLAITLFSIIFILGIIGNGLVIWIAGFRMKKTISAAWFLHLAIADFLCCASIPLRVAQWVSIAVCLVSSGILCILNSILLYINMSASVLLLTAMSIDRWVSVMWPFWSKVHRTRKRVRVTAGMIWGMSFVWTGLLYYLFHFYDYNADQTVPLTRLFTVFVIPFFIIFTSYVTIFLKFRNSNRPPRSQRPYRIITAVILCFFICWAPYYIWPLLPIYDGGDLVQFFTIDTIITCLAYLNSCINPIIYVFMGEDFRHGFLRSIPFRLKKALSELPDDHCREREVQEQTPTTDRFSMAPF